MKNDSKPNWLDNWNPAPADFIIITIVGIMIVSLVLAGTLKL